MDSAAVLESEVSGSIPTISPSLESDCKPIELLLLWPGHTDNQ